MLTVANEFLSKPVLRIAESQLRPARRGTQVPTEVLDPSARTKQAAASAFEQITNTFIRFKLVQDQKEKVRREQDFLSATGILQQRFDIDLKRELLKYYTSDGQDLTPPEGTSTPIGRSGIQLTAKDFISEETGRRKPYSDVVESLHKRFSEERYKSLPSKDIEGVLNNRLEQGTLRAMIGAYSYQDARQGVKLANNLNSVVRSYKEAIHDERNFSADTFAVHVDAMAEAVAGASQMVDVGAASEAFRVSLGDMLSLGLTDAMLNRENMLPFTVLREGQLLDTREVRKALTALPPKDNAMLRGLKAKKKMSFSFNSNAPDDKSRYIEWALAQMPLDKLSDLQMRSINSFKSQNQQIRAELKDRLQGVFASVTTPLIKDIGHRQQIEKSLKKAVSDINRVYPRSLFPQENSKLMASALVGQQIMEIRNDLDTVHTANLKNFVQEKTVEMSNDLRAKLPDQDWVKTLPLTEQVHKHLMAFAENEANIRRLDPFGAIKISNKDVRELDKKLTSGKYTNTAERFRDQAVLRRRVIRRAGELGIMPSFITGNDKAVLKTLSDNNMVGQFNKVMKEIRQRYGDVTFFEHIAPEIARDPHFKGGMPVYSMVPDESISGIFSDATINARANSELAKKIGVDTSGIENTVNETYSWYEWYDGWGRGDYLMESLDGFIEDRFTGADSNRLKGAMRKAVYDKALQFMVTGVHSNGRDATRAAVDLLEGGLGYQGEFDGRKRILSPTVGMNQERINLANDVVRNPLFLQENVYPYISANPNTIHKAKELGVSTQEVLRRYFEDDEVIEWKFGFEGMYPVEVNESFPELSSVVPNIYGEGFIIEYPELRTLIVNPRYHE